MDGTLVASQQNAAAINIVGDDLVTLVGGVDTGCNGNFPVFFMLVRFKHDGECFVVVALAAKSLALIAWWFSDHYGLHISPTRINLISTTVENSQKWSINQVPHDIRVR